MRERITVKIIHWSLSLSDGEKYDGKWKNETRHKHLNVFYEKSFLDLIKIHTSAHPFDSEEDSTLIIPSVSADRDFYEQEWVQKILAKKMEKEQFRKYFWKAVFSRQNNTLFKSTASELKRYISIRKSEWARLGMTVAGIKKELQSKKLLSRELRAKGTLEKFLERCGVKRLRRKEVRYSVYYLTPFPACKL